MLRLILFGIICIVGISGENKKEERIIHLPGLGTIIGEKFWDGEFYEFLGIPYATAPKGRDRFKPPLPPTPWKEEMEAKRGLLICQQVYMSDQEDEEDLLYGSEECLVASFFVPKIATRTNLVPIVIYIHSGGFAGGSGNMAKFHHLARQDILVVNFNYRVGALGFACLGTEDIPGNAALKDIIAAIKFIRQHAKSFGGDADDITLAGFSVGSVLAEIIALSEEARGLFRKLILDSGSALTPFAVNRHPIETAKNIAKGIGYKDTGYLEDLNEFLLECDTRDLLDRSRNFFLRNSTFGFAPCIENPSNPGAVLTESPLDIFKKRKYSDFALLIGFGNMEGISRTSMFDEWRGLMNKKFDSFLPGDLVIDNEKERDDFIEEIKKYYFDNKMLTADSIQGFIDYFSDSMFKYGIMKSVKLHAEVLRRPIYLYEFTYVGKLNTKHAYGDRVNGASHRDASAYVMDFYDWTRNFTDLDMVDRMTGMWADFIKEGNPTIYESTLLKAKWLPYTNKNTNYLEIGYDLVMKKELFSKGYQFWDRVYKKYYWNPTVVNPNAYKKKPITEKTAEPSTKSENKPADDNSNSSPPTSTTKSETKTETKDSKEKIDQKLEETKPIANNAEKSFDASKTQSKPVESKQKATEQSVTPDAKKTDTKPVETKPVGKKDEKPVETKKMEQKPVETKPIVKNPGKSAATETNKNSKEEVKE